MKSVKTIFLIDDDKDDQDFFIAALTGIENVCLFGIANNGKEALDILVNSVSLPDVIFLDFNMPGMNGIECLVNIKKSTITKDIPVFMLSSALEQAELGRRLGAKGFIKKSSSIYELRTELQHILNLGIVVNYIIPGQTNSIPSKKENA
jgi:CheY-like chemotaxis protein